MQRNQSFMHINAYAYAFADTSRYKYVCMYVWTCAWTYVSGKCGSVKEINLLLFSSLYTEINFLLHLHIILSERELHNYELKKF